MIKAKILSAVLLVACLASSVSIAVSAADDTHVKGDANIDGKVTIRDAAYIANFCAKRMQNKLPEWSDYNYDGTGNIRDAADIAKDLSGISVSKTQIKFRFASKTEGTELR